MRLLLFTRPAALSYWKASNCTAMSNCCQLICRDVALYYMIWESSTAINDWRIYPRLTKAVIYPPHIPSHMAVVVTHAAVLSCAAYLSVSCGSLALLLNLE